MKRTRKPGVPSAKAAGRSGNRGNPPRQGYTSTAAPSSGGNGQLERRGRWVALPTRQGRKFVGWLERRNGAVAFVKRAKLSRHLLRELDAWGVQAGLLDWLDHRNIELVEVREGEQGVLYQATLDTFLAHGVLRDLGHGEQIFLAREHWEKSPEPQQRLFPVRGS